MSSVNSLDDPFSKVYNALWETAIAHPFISQAFNLGNRVDLNNGKRSYVKKHLTSADLPELILVPTNLKGSIHSSSSSSSCTKRYQWVITTGDYRVDRHLFPLSWAIFSSMVRCQKQVTALRWMDQPFVRRMDLVDSTDGQSAAQRESNIEGWSTVQTIEVEMHFHSSTIITQASP